MRLWSDELEAMRPEAVAQVAPLLELVVASRGDGSGGNLTVEETVANQRAWMAQMNQPSDEASPEEIAGVPCRVFRPTGDATAVYLHFHGGGMIIGTPEMNDPTNEALRDAHGVAVVSVDYRLAPEHPYPAGPDDGVAVARWLVENGAAEFGTERIIVGGESAGGYLAAAVLLRMRDELDAADRVIGANLVFGVHDWGRSPSQRGVRTNTGPDMLDPGGIEFFTECYLPGMTADERRDPAVSPAYADLSGLPPAFMSVGTADHLLDDTIMLAGRWAASENEVELMVLPDMPHGFLFIPCEMTKAWETATDRWFADILSR